MSEVTIQDIFSRFYAGYLDNYTPSAVQAKTAAHILNCKTGAYGSNISTCSNCGHMEFHHNSCRDRCCPMCQAYLKEVWVDAQKESLLAAPYYHVVFTLPHELNPLMYNNQKELYNLLFRASTETVMDLAEDEKYLGARTGIISVIHTWGSGLSYHPHLHLIVLGGGLDSDKNWAAKNSGFFLPVRGMSAVFQGKFMSGLKSLAKESRLSYTGTAAKYRNRFEFKGLLDACYGKQWVPYCKEPFSGAGCVLEYLGRYTNRIAIGNGRIASMDENTVTYMAKDYKQGGKWKKATVSGVEFIRRYLMHVPPKRFVRVRHYGLLSARNKNTKIPLCRNLIGCQKYLSGLKGLDAAQILLKLYGFDIYKCPCCGGKKGEAVFRPENFKSEPQPVKT